MSQELYPKPKPVGDPNLNSVGGFGYEVVCVQITHAFANEVEAGEKITTSRKRPAEDGAMGFSNGNR